jgi:flavin reductase (DIM6/NTAB) family NADH-FMN oxidoreductase RutF
MGGQEKRMADGFEHFDLGDDGEVGRVQGAGERHSAAADCMGGLARCGGRTECRAVLVLQHCVERPTDCGRSASPPAPDREGKDTLANIRARGEFVVNMVPEESRRGDERDRDQRSARDTDETQLAGLELVPCELVKVPRIAGSPVALECRVFEFIEPGGASTILLARIVYAHVRTSAFANVARLHIDPAQMRLIGRMHGAGGYCTTRDVFTIERKSWPLEQ